jgi:predicted dehydrogenase
MIDEERLDGVVVCINAAIHPKVVIDLAEAGLDVLVEKPAAVTPEAAQEMADAARKAGRFIMVEHNKRYATAIRKAKAIMGGEAFGNLVMVNSSMLAYPYDTLFDCMMEWQIHNIDLLRLFAGDVAEVHAMKRTVDDQRAAIAILMQFESGVVGTTHWGTEGGTNHGLGAGRGCERMELISDTAHVLVIENDRRIVHYHGNDAQTWESDWSPHRQNSSLVIDGYVGVLEAFTESIVSRTPPDPDIEDEIAAIRFVHQVAEQLDIPQEWKVVEGKP